MSTKKQNEILSAAGYIPVIGRPRIDNTKTMLPALRVSQALRNALRAQAEQSRTPEATVRRIALAAYLTEEVSK